MLYLIRLFVCQIDWEVFFKSFASNPIFNDITYMFCRRTRVCQTSRWQCIDWCSPSTSPSTPGSTWFSLSATTFWGHVTTLSGVSTLLVVLSLMQIPQSVSPSLSGVRPPCASCGPLHPRDLAHANHRGEWRVVSKISCMFKEPTNYLSSPLKATQVHKWISTVS